MALYVTSLNSGSNGNCYYIGNDREAVLVDVGISCREIDKRMARLGLSMQKVKAVFVSHEHTDHIRGLPSLAKKYQLPVYITTNTLSNCGFVSCNFKAVPFNINQEINIGDIVVKAFAKHHDACDPCSFTISYNGVKVGVFTDIGTPCKNVIAHFKQCHAAFLEANYGVEMLSSGGYPYHLKKRISGGNGHLSNKQALDLFKAHKAPYMSHLFLSHLSKNNNCPDLVQKLFDQHAKGVKIIVASRYEETIVEYICNNKAEIAMKKQVVKPSQLAFAFA